MLLGECIVFPELILWMHVFQNSKVPTQKFLCLLSSCMQHTHAHLVSITHAQVIQISSPFSLFADRLTLHLFVTMFAITFWISLPALKLKPTFKTAFVSANWHCGYGYIEMSSVRNLLCTSQVINIWIWVQRKRK